MIILDDTWYPKKRIFTTGYLRYHKFGDEEFYCPIDSLGNKNDRTVHIYIKHDMDLRHRDFTPAEGIAIITIYNNKELN
jgi:hypothetical protein